MSEIKTNKLTGTSTAGSILVTGEGNSTTTNLQQGLCKQWIKFSSVDHSIADSFNTTSITDNGTADTSITINNNMSTVNYSIGALATDHLTCDKDYEGTDPTSTLYRLFNFIVSGTSGQRTANAEDRVYAHIFGDLA
tara:strand:- start:503 stop:913 length:411 start_codon:yes stop_codon:yes gene_type:complete